MFKRQYVVTSIILLIVFASLFVYNLDQNKKRDALYTEYISKASNNLGEDNISSAITNLTEAIEIKPGEPKAYGGRAFVYFLNEQNDEALKDTEQVLSLSKGDTAHIYELRGQIFQAKDDIKSAVEAYGLAYTASSSDRDYVHRYVVSLITDEQNDKAYNVIKKYFIDTDKNVYWEDIDIWMDMGISSIATHRCLEAGANAWHLLNRTEDGDERKDMAEAILSTALNSKDCIDTGDTKMTSVESMKDAVANTESKIMK